jgi:autoinducer 2-degrading protein
MYTVLVRLEIYPDTLDEFTAGIHANAQATLRDEPGCIRFDVHQDLATPTTFYFYEIYADRQAFEVAHRQAPHYARWRDVVSRCVIPGSQHNTYAEPLFPQDIPENFARSNA